MALSVKIPDWIDRRYRVLAPLGSGLSGEIYKVQGPEGPAALKLLKTEVPGLDPEGAIASFKFEFSLLKDLNHPNVIRIFDFGFDEPLGRFYFTEELLEGASLKANPAPGEPPLSLEILQKIFVQALQGLAYLHSHDVIHGDIKPENLLLTSTDPSTPHLKIIDFGVSHPSFVQKGGTPAYMAPEKILKETVDSRGDLYSLAVVFYTLMTGKNPFVRSAVPETLAAHLHYLAPSATSLRPELDPLWSELIAWMLKKNPRTRIPSAEACLKFLETKGEVNFEIKRPRLLPQAWIGRQKILEEACRFLDELKSHPKKNRVLWVEGEAGLGKDNLLTELKYEAELRKLEVIAPEEIPLRHPALLFLKTENLREIFKKKSSIEAILNQWAGKASLIMAIPPELQEEIRGKWARKPDQVLTLRPLSAAETETYLTEVTRNQEVPQPFLRTLYRFTGGNPGQLNEALGHLLKDPDIVDASGKWNLAVFREAEPNLEQLGLSESALEQAGARITDPGERWELQLKRATLLANQGKVEPAFQLLKSLEEQVSGIFSIQERLAKKAQLLEKRGWIYTRQGRYPEARESYAAGLSLLAECETPQPVLQNRLKNFIAFLDLQVGKYEEAIQQFQRSAQLAETLPKEKQRQITNNELGSAYLAAGRLDEAIECLKKDLNFFSQFHEAFLLMKAQYNLAEAYNRKGKYPEAHESYQRVAQLARRERHWDYLVRAYNGLGNTATLQGNRLEALDYYQRSLALAEYLKDYLSATTVAQNRGVLLSELGRLDEARYDLEISKRLIGKLPPSSHSRYLMARATLELGEVFLKKKDYQKAHTLFAEAMNRTEEDPGLKSFRFYPLAAMAKLALEENRFESFRELYPNLAHLAESDEEKKMLAQLTARAPGDPCQGLEHREAPGPADDVPVSAWVAPRFPAEALFSILKINRALLTEHDPEALFPKILEYAAELSGAESAVLLEVSEGNQLSRRAAFNAPGGPGEEEVSQHIAQKVLSSGKPIATHDALGDVEYSQFESVVELHLRSIACIPIRLQHKVIGLLYLTHRNKTQLFGTAILNALEAFADQAALALQNANQVYQLRTLNEQLQHQLSDANDFIDQLQTDLRARVKNAYPKILGKSRPIVDILQTLDRISDTPLTVLILGETGSGKELVARAMHDHSRRRKAPFVAVNCGAIPENLIESELFGYVTGAFTGAVRNKKGLMEEANGGTLFLDEVSELPLHLQVKLLRFLQEREVVRLGSNQIIPIDVRVIAATHRDLEQWVREGRFREDLYYRIAQMVLPLPPLRERMEDLPILVDAFLEKMAHEMEMKKPRLGRDLLQKMMQYPWPGNIRELENVIRAAAAFADRGVIHLEQLPSFLKEKLENQKLTATLPAPVAPGQLPYFKHWPMERYEEALFAKSFIRHGQDCDKVAEELGVGIATVYVKVRKYQLKQNLTKWEDTDLTFPANITLAELKRKITQKSFLENDQSPYAVAKELGINVGTVYRYLKDGDGIKPH
jgi:transcriptional regulator with GAF, ATPase, and Fis domain